MTVWRGCPVATYYVDGLDDSLECEVRIDGPVLVVSFGDGRDGPPDVYRGEEVGPGHYRVMGADGSKGTLHRLSPDDEWLEGYFQEDGERGMWRIQLVSE